VSSIKPLEMQMIASVFEANGTGVSQSPSAASSFGDFGLAAARRSAGAPFSICWASWSEPANE
jgi:hypothetical protein